MKIDSHQHLWKLARGDYHWLTPELGPIHRDFSPPDLAPHLTAAGVSKTVVVQAADSVSETDFLLETAAATDWIGAVVGWIDMEAKDAIATLDRLAAHPKFRGIRPMIQGIEDEEWILRTTLDPVFDALVERGLTFDALVVPHHLPHLLSRLQRHPDLRCVIDHGAKPNLVSGDITEWRHNIARLACETASCCKLSGLLTEAGDQPTLDRIRPAADHLLASFGPKRLMFGSDWPVLNLAASYSLWAQMVDALLAELPDSDAAYVWAKTASSFYSLDGDVHKT